MEGRDGAEKVRSLRGKREDSREKREEIMTLLVGSRISTTKISRSKDAMVRSQEGRDGTERVRSLRGKREDKHDQDEKVE